MPIFQSGTLNTSTLIVPDIYVGIVPPQTLIAGVPSNVLGVVGSASWGPVNTPVVFGDVPGAALAFGGVKARKHDLSTVVATAALQGAASFRGVRVTDGTDNSASVLLPGADLAAAPAFWAAAAAAVNSGVGVQRNASLLVSFDADSGEFRARHTGSYGNAIGIATAKGSRAGTFRLVVSAPGRQPEVFDNLPAAAGAAPALKSYALASGTDGADAVDEAALVGDEATGTGMHALRDQNTAAFVLADCSDSSSWSVQAAFALSESSLAVLAGPPGDYVELAISRKQAAGIDSEHAWVLHGDWIHWADQANDVIRLVSPAGFAAGRVVALSPQESPLNKPLYGILGTQKTGTPGANTSPSYSTAELSALFEAGIDVVCNPAPGGAYFAVRAGHNSSSNAATSGLAYTTMTNFVAKSLLATMGKFVGQTTSETNVRRANAALNAFCADLQAQGMIGSLDGSQPWRVVCDASNNPTSRTGIGYLKAAVQMQYLGIIEKFLVDLEGGASVTVGG